MAKKTDASPDRGEWERLSGVLGPCECPGRPHVTDTYGYKSRLFFGDWRRVASAPAEDKTAVLLVRAITDWNLVDADGDPIPVDVEGVDGLSIRQSAKLVEAIDSPSYTVGAFGMLDADPKAAAPSPSDQTQTPDA